MADADPPPARKARSQRVKRVDTCDPVEIAMKRTRSTAAASAAAETLLERQARLVRLQIASERMSLALKTMTAFVGLAVAVAAAALLWSASRASGLVFSSLSVPPQLAQRGLTGEAVAGQLIDRVRRLDEGVDSIRAPSSYTNDWSGRIAVEIPNTGVSVAELSRHLRQWLGRQTPVTGEVFRSGGGYGLTVRVGDRSGSTFTMPEADFERLLDRAAEAVFHATQPYRYGGYLRSRQRWAEAVRVFEEIAHGSDAAERSWGYLGIGNLVLVHRGDRPSRIWFLRATSAGTDNPLAWSNLAAGERRLGLTQAAADHIQRSIAALSGSGRRFIREESRNEADQTTRGAALLIGGDPEAAVAALTVAERQIGAFDLTEYRLALAYAAAHRPRAARRIVNEVRPLTDQQMQAMWLNVGSRAEALVAAAVEEEDWPSVVREVDALRSLAAGNARGQAELARVMPTEALALARLGRTAEAQASIDQTPPDCYPCLIVRGRVAALADDRRSADRWFAEAVRQGPRLPFAHTEWGRELLRRGELDAAIARFETANRIQPRYADPLRYWGDALAFSGDHRAAVARYAAAAQRAPGWGALHINWGISLWRTGRRDEAREKWRAAADMGLSRGDRGRLERIRRRAGLQT